MSSPVEKLLKILRLEAEEHQDRAMIGGLTRFVDTWRGEARAAYGPPAGEWIETVAQQLATYSRLPGPDERRPALQELMETLEQGPPSTPTPAPRPSPPAPAQAPASRSIPPPPAPTPTPHPTPPADPPRGLNAPVTVLRGVGEQQARRMERLGLRTVRDVVYFLPRRYDDFSSLKPINRLDYGEEATVVAQVWDAGTRRARSGQSIFQAVLSDETGLIEATWFNQPYLAQDIKPGRHIVVSGKVDEYLGRLCFVSPEWELLRKDLLHTGRLVPVYPLTAGVTARWLRRTIKQTIDYWAPRIPDHLPESVRRDQNLIDLSTALTQIHFPDHKDHLEKARYRLAFDEMFVFQLGLLGQRRQWRSAPGRELPIEDAEVQAFVLSLPFHLTGAQQRTLGQIVADLRSSVPMNRLLQGDVGSGKTVVAAAAMALATQSGVQAALMAPTEILAEQHLATLTRIFEGMPGHGPAVRLLTGSVTGAERDEVYTGLADGSIDIAVGTHALIQAGVEFRDLALIVIDEQHRFGVEQRAALRQKGYNPHLMVMTATPIPRSLQLTIWGHLDVSVIDEMPPGRQPVTTRLIMPRERERAYAFLRSQVEQGRQAFIICPLVEESNKIEARAAVEEYEQLKKEVFPDLRMGLLHGRMKADKKDTTMAAFARGELDILVATSVVEVGIDVPNATVMFIEGAERFGLSQLHQFRGRVGRGEHESFCLLVAESSSEEVNERLTAVQSTNDGFVLAQKDLDLRGPGEFLGIRQSGFPELKMASLTDLRLLETVREAARRFFETDPELECPEHRLLAGQVSGMWQVEGEVS